MTAITKELNNYQGFPAENTPIRDRLNLKVGCINNILEKMAVQIGIKDISKYDFIFSVERNPFSIGGESSIHKTLEFNRLIRIGALLLIDPRTIPSKFLVSDFNDTRLADSFFLNQAILWLNENYFKIDDLDPDTVSEQERHELRLFLVLASDPEKFEKVFDSTIAHESAHQLLGHCKNPLYKIIRSDEIDNQVKEALAYALGAGAVFGILGSMVSNDFRIQAFFGLIGTVSGLVLPLINLQNYYLKSRHREWEADLTAARTLNNASGALYEFETREKYFQHQLEKDHPENQKKILKNLANNYWHETHPSDRKRIDYLTKFQNSLSK